MNVSVNEIQQLQLQQVGGNVYTTQLPFLSSSGAGTASVAAACSLHMHVASLKHHSYCTYSCCTWLFL